MNGVETQHLRVDWSGMVFAINDDEDHRLGFVDNDPSWPSRLGPEPDWFEDELANLLDQFDDAQGNDYRPDVEMAFRRAIGGLR